METKLPQRQPVLKFDKLNKSNLMVPKALSLFLLTKQLWKNKILEKTI